MKYLIPVLVGAATITVAITTALAQAHGAFNGHTYLWPYLYGYGFAVLLLVIAVILAAKAAKQERSLPQTLPLPALLANHIKQTVEANPSQHVHLGADFLQELRKHSGDSAAKHRPEQGAQEPVRLLELFDAKPMLIVHNGWGWHEVDQSQPRIADNKLMSNSFVAIFRNQPAPKGKAAPAIYEVAAHLIYRNNKGEQLAVDFGTWLDHYAHFADFTPGKNQGLILSCIDRAGERRDGRIYAFDNPHRTDPRRQRFRHNIVLSAPKAKAVISESVELEIMLVADGVTVYHDTFKCSFNSDGTMNEFIATVR